MDIIFNKKVLLMLIESLFLKKISIMKNYPTPIFEDDVKLQAILLYCKERLNDSISLFQKNISNLNNDDTLLLEFKFESTYVYNQTLELFDYLNKNIPSLDDIEQIMLNKNKSSINQIKYLEVIKVAFYYNKIVEYYSLNYSSFFPSKMIMPDLLAFSLINGWHIEARKETTTYQELYTLFDFNLLLSKFNEISLKKKNTKYSDLIKSTYNITDKIINELSLINFNKNFKKKAKKRK